MTDCCAESVLHDMVLQVMKHLVEIADHEFASQRTTADQIEHEVRSRLLALDSGFAPPQGPRRPADVIWKNYHINIKSMDLARTFHMPNLISANSLKKLLTQGDHFMLLRLSHRHGQIENWDLWNIQDISWDHLTLGALGAGQIQIRDASRPLTAHGQDRAHWQDQWYQRMIDFYHREKVKIDKRIHTWQKH